MTPFQRAQRGQTRGLPGPGPAQSGDMTLDWGGQSPNPRPSEETGGASLRPGGPRAGPQRKMDAHLTGPCEGHLETPTTYFPRWTLLTGRGI